MHLHSFGSSKESIKPSPIMTCQTVLVMHVCLPLAIPCVTQNLQLVSTVSASSAKAKGIGTKKQWTLDAFMTSSVFCYSRHGFLELQSPVSSLWMYPRPPFQPQPYSFGIIVPKVILGNTDLKTAISSTVFVTVHSSTDSSRKYYFVATTKRSRMEQSYKAAECLRGTFLWSSEEALKWENPAVHPGGEGQSSLVM